MNPKGVPVKILVLPIFRRHWCFHAVEDVQAAQKLATEASNIEWRKGANLEEKLSLLGTKISSRVSLQIHEASQSQISVQFIVEGPTIVCSEAVSQ